MQDALDDVAEELAFKVKNPRKPIPLPVLSEDVTATLRFSMGDVTVRFYPNVAKKHVERFLDNCANGLYDGTRITRVNDNTITAGDLLSKDGLVPDPRGAGRAANAPASIPHEFSGLTHKRGIVSMLRNPIGNDSSGTTFCFVMKDFSALDLQQTPFAEVVSGMEVLDAMTRVGRAQGEAPASPINLRAVSVTKGGEAPTREDKK
jgi:peptidyl-prolyl cis-trans isomerase B (cyclophilin B)